MTTIGDKNPIRTLGDYSRTSHEGYRNTIELPDRNKVVPLRSDTIRLVQNGCSFHELRSKDPNQHLKDFIKLVDSLDLDVANREGMRLHLFQFFLHDQASNLLERLPAGSISNWEDLTISFLAQFFPLGRTAKLRNDILMFQQHQEDLTLYDNESWNDPRDFAKPFKAIFLPQDVPSTSDCRLIKLENQAINDRMTGSLPSDAVKNLKLNVNPTSLALSDCSYPMGDTKAHPIPTIRSMLLIHERNRNSSFLKRVHFINTITIISKGDELREAVIVEPNATKDDNHNTIVEIEKKVGEELSGSKIVIVEGESRHINADNPDDMTCEDTEEVEEVKEESEESEEEVEEELKEDEEEE
ncbi:MAK10-like protein [Tanacetum coccineum]